ncbi:hypothetical protein, partial [Leptospira ryugenii]|uniref:hypothetical protein n=1 Tax=Leptospira ryugenii TaxID=1917863 RepID=UPI001AE15DC1
MNDISAVFYFQLRALPRTRFDSETSPKIKKPHIFRRKAFFSSNNLYTTEYQIYGMASRSTRGKRPCLDCETTIRGRDAKHLAAKLFGADHQTERKETNNAIVTY